MIKTIILIAVLTLLSQWEVKLRMKREGASKEYTVLQHVVDFTVMMQWGGSFSPLSPTMTIPSPPPSPSLSSPS